MGIDARGFDSGFGNLTGVGSHKSLMPLCGDQPSPCFTNDNALALHMRQIMVKTSATAALIGRGARVLGDTQEGLHVPYIEPFNTSVYAQYTLQSDDRDAVIARLQAQGIPTTVYYPIPRRGQHRDLPVRRHATKGML